MPGSFEEFDRSAWDRGEEIFEAWKPRLYNKELFYEIVGKVKDYHLARNPYEICAPRKGAFNVYYRVRFTSDKDAMIRIAQPAYFRCIEEKLVTEVAAIRYISHHTTVPVPLVLHHGMQEECPGEVGPFMIMTWIENTGDLSDLLKTPGLGDKVPAVFNPDLDETKIEHLYGQVADVLLQLSQCEFTSIGSLGFPNGRDSDPEVVGRPLSINILQLGNFARVPHFELPSPSKTFKTSSEYYSALADMHLQQLSYQRNNAIKSADECRKKYIARQLFRKLASENRLADSEFDQGPFKLWCDDLRPHNVLVHETDRIAAVIDWEFTYSAPAEFSLSPPWWLILTAPDDWKEGLDDWAAHYEPKLATFLRALEAKEKQFIEQGRLKASDIMLSTRMRESWESGNFWLTFAARRTWAFDGIYWNFLDEKYFGKNESGDFKERLKLLPPEQIDAMEAFVERKLREKEEHTIVDWYEPGAESKLPPDVLKT